MHFVLQTQFLLNALQKDDLFSFIDCVLDFDLYMMKNTAIISVGSNIQPDIHIPQARNLISKHHRIIAESDYVRTKPIGYLKQDDFINCALKIETDLSFLDLKLFLKEIELKLIRVRTKNRYGPRTIDLDIVVWNGTIIDKNVFTRDFLKKSVQSLDSELFNCI